MTKEEYKEELRKTYQNVIDECKQLNISDIGTMLFLSGWKPNVATSIADMEEYGYGELDSNGFWQFPVPIYLIKVN